MLVPVVYPVAREMLGAGCHARFLERFHVGTGQPFHPPRIRAVCAAVGDGVAEVHVDVRHRGKSPVDRCGLPLCGTDLGKMCRVAIVLTGGDLELVGKIGAVAGGPRAALLQVGSMEQGVLGQGVQPLKMGGNLRRGTHGTEQHAANPPFHQPVQLLRRAGVAQDTEQLTEFFLLGHGGQGGLNPILLLLGEIKGFCF